MPFSIYSDLNKTNTILDLIGAKQEVIGTNIANVNTPGYVRKDLKFDNYLSNLSKPLETKLSNKMGSCPISPEEEETVNLGQELMAMQKNALFYTMATKRASKIIQEMKTVMQVGK